MRIERRKTKLMLMAVIVLLITTGIFAAQPPDMVEMCNPGTQAVQAVPANTVDHRLNAGWTFPPCLVEIAPSALSSVALEAPPLVSTPHSTGRPPDILPDPTRRPPEVPPENPPGHFTDIPPIIPTPIPTSPPTFIPISTLFPTEVPTSTITPTLTPTVEPNLAPIPEPIEVPILIMTETPRLVPTVLPGGTGTAPQTPTSPNDVQLLIDFIERNPGVLIAVIAIIGLIPLMVRAEVNRRTMAFNDQLADNKQQRDLIDRQQQSLERSDEIRLQERRESRKDFLDALTDLTVKFTAQAEAQTNKFSMHIGQLAANQAATTAALEQNNLIATELVEQLKLIREDAAKRDELHRTVRKAVEDNGEKVKTGFKEVSKTIKALSESVIALKSKWEEHHHFDETVIEELQNVKRIVESVNISSEHPKGES